MVDNTYISILVLASNENLVLEYLRGAIESVNHEFAFYGIKKIVDISKVPISLALLILNVRQCKLVEEDCKWMNFALWWRGSATNGATPSSLVSTFLYSISSSAQYDRVERPWQVQRCVPSQDQETEDPQ